MLEMISFITVAPFQPRHWEMLSDRVLKHCNLSLKFPENKDEVSHRNLIAMDISKDEPAPLGMLNSVYVSELVKRYAGVRLSSETRQLLIPSSSSSSPPFVCLTAAG